MKKIALIFGGVILLAGTVAFATISSTNDCCTERQACCAVASECCVK